jgi:hypothetical protein
MFKNLVNLFKTTFKCFNYIILQNIHCAINFQHIPELEKDKNYQILLLTVARNDVENITGRPLLKRHSEQAWICGAVFLERHRGARARIQIA